MSIRKKHYPHPVLEGQFSTEDSDFQNSDFEAFLNVQLNKDGTEINIESIFELKNETLNELIKEGKATFALLFICESTVTRILKYTNKYEDKLNMSTKSLNKTVTIRPYILAEENIQQYKNSSLVAPIKYFEFEVKRGDILATAAHTERYIEKENLIETGSIFDFVELKSKNPPLVSYDANYPKIQISLPSAIYDKVEEYNAVKGSINDILISLFYVPAVIHALYSVVALNKDQHGEANLLEYKDYNWYNTLQKKFRDLKLGEDLSTITEDKVNDYAHRLMENPNDKALLAIEDLIYGSEENQ